MKRILCLWLPNWTIQRLVSEQPELRGRPIVLHAPDRGKPTVAACSPGAARRGVCPGMPLAEAQTFWSLDSSSSTEDRSEGTGPHFAPHDVKADQRALVRWAFFAQRYSPFVALEENENPECLLLDITGCAPLFDGEKALADRAVFDLRCHGLTARAAIADTIGAAWALAHGSASQVTVAPVGKQREHLGPSDLALLRLPGDVVRRLREFDLCSIQQLMDLPRPEVAVRFGQDVLVRLDQAMGDMPEVLKPEQFVEPVQASWSFEDATDQRWVVEKVIEHLLQGMLDRIGPEQLGIERLVCELITINKERTVLPIGLLEPSDARRYLMELVQLHLEKVRLPAEIDRIALRATVAPRGLRQRELFASDSDTANAFRALVERLSSRVGENAVLRAHLRPEVQPEYVRSYSPWLEQRADGRPSRPLAMLARPSQLRKSPEPVRMEARGAPIRFVWRGIRYRVARTWGPERIETSWWRGPDVRRDYYRVEAEGGQRFWLFRDLVRGTWFLHGIYG
jgi:protein ImuB